MQAVNKFGWAAIGVAAVGLYLFLGEEEKPKPVPESAPPVTRQAPPEPQRTVQAPAAPKPYSYDQRPGWDQGSYAPPAIGYDYPPSTGNRGENTYPPASGYAAPSQAYRFRPLGEREKARMEEQAQAGYSLVDPYHLPPRSGPGLAGMPINPDHSPRQEPSPGYGGNRPAPSAYPPPGAAYAPGNDPYAAPQPVPGYGSGNWSQPAPPGYYGSGSSYPAQQFAPGYDFRPIEADLRRRDGYSLPPSYPQRRRQPSQPRSRDWPPSAPGQRSPSTNGPLWASSSAWY